MRTSRGCALVVVYILEQLFEHASSCARGRYKLKCFDVFEVVVVVCLALLNALCIELLYAIATSCGTHHWECRETITEILDLSFNRCDAQAVSLNLGDLFVCEHRLYI